MNIERIKEILEKIPFKILLAAYLGYLGLDLYNFMKDPASSLNTKNQELAAAQGDLSKLKARKKEVEEFKKGLESKRQELRALAKDLEDTKAVLADIIDVPSFMKQVLTEAKKVGMVIKSLRPGVTSREEYYSEQSFELTFRGAYVQTIGFMERLASLQTIVRMDNFKLKTSSKSSAKFVELDGTMQLKTYRYLGSKADDVAKGSSGASAPAAAPATAPAPTEKQPGGA